MCCKTCHKYGLKALEWYSAKNRCFSRPCKNNGRCLNYESIKGFMCECPEGFIGEFCERKLQKCSGLNNFEFYQRTTSGKVLNCKQVFTGELSCSTSEVSRTCNRICNPCYCKPCLNEGKCVPLENSDYKCECKYGYVGKSCEIFRGCKDGNGRFKIRDGIGKLIGWITCQEGLVLLGPSYFCSVRKDDCCNTCKKWIKRMNL